MRSHIVSMGGVVLLELENEILCLSIDILIVGLQLFPRNGWNLIKNIVINDTYREIYMQFLHGMHYNGLDLYHEPLQSTFIVPYAIVK